MCSCFFFFLSFLRISVCRCALSFYRFLCCCLVSMRRRRCSLMMAFFGCFLSCRRKRGGGQSFFSPLTLLAPLGFFRTKLLPASQPPSVSGTTYITWIYAYLYIRIRTSSLFSPKCGAARMCLGFFFLSLSLSLCVYVLMRSKLVLLLNKTKNCDDCLLVCLFGLGFVVGFFCYACAYMFVSAVCW